MSGAANRAKQGSGNPPGTARLPETVARQVRALSAEAAALREEAGGGCVTDTLAQWLAGQLAAAARGEMQAAEGGVVPLATLRGLVADTAALRKGDHSAERLRSEREWLELEREKLKARGRTAIEAGLEAIAEDIRGNAAAMEAFEKLKKAMKLEPHPLSEEERAERMRRIFGLPTPLKRGLSPEALAEIEKAASVL